MPLPRGEAFSGCSEDALLSVELGYLGCGVVRWWSVLTADERSTWFGRAIAYG